MSSASPGAVWQRADLVEWFLDGRQSLLPLIDVQEDVVRRLFERHARKVQRFIDIGSGDGALSALMLSIADEAEGVLVDFSEPMLERAERRLRGRGRWQTVRGDLSDPDWTAALPAGSFDAAVSSLAIHHLPAERKRALFAELFALLEPGGMFVNLDYVLVDGPLEGLWEEQMLANAERLERERGGTRTAAELERDLLSDSDEDRPDGAEDQLRWLSDAGFEAPELHFKWAEAAVFSAVKPAGAR